jgi:hypothetical protein
MFMGYYGIILDALGTRKVNAAFPFIQHLKLDHDETPEGEFETIQKAMTEMRREAKERLSKENLELANFFHHARWLVFSLTPLTTSQLQVRTDYLLVGTYGIDAEIGGIGKKQEVCPILCRLELRHDGTPEEKFKELKLAIENKEKEAKYKLVNQDSEIASLFHYCRWLAFSLTSLSTNQLEHPLISE